MSSMNSQLRLMGAFAALATLALAISCRGFFVKPTLSSLAIGPVSPSIFTGNVDNTVQMFAVGTFNDGSNGSTPVTWSISGTGTGGTAVATISPGGLVTAQATGTGTITAASNILPSITGTQPITVSVACTSAPVISPTSGTLTPNQPTLPFTASCNGGQDITSVATWLSSNTLIATVSAGVVTAIATTLDNGTFTITASSNGLTSAPVSITASGF
jgi:trimeric autotransporter adhesin